MLEKDNQVDVIYLNIRNTMESVIIEFFIKCDQWKFFFKDGKIEWNRVV